MPLQFLLLLAIVQGLTEFLPVSSSAHLVLLHTWTGTEADGLALDIAVHVGSIAAVMLYVRAELARVLRGLVTLARGQIGTPDAFLALCLILSTVPVVIVGGILAVTGWVEALRSVTVIGWMMIVFGIVLWMVDRRAPETRQLSGWTLGHALRMGLWQVLALVPGTSRSGITITAARLYGYGRTDSARLSMLMSIPTILASGALLGLDLIGGDPSPGLATQAGIAAALAFVAAYASLVVMIRLIPRVSFTPWVIYRIALGVVLLAIAYG
jgi:undecaprenyl-diphosphatase